MSDLIDKLWPAFSAEVSEQLEAIELALVTLEQEGQDATDVNALFRHFHTIKGGCAMMGFAHMESVAHASEDLLDPIRKGVRQLDTEVIDMLLSALDGLKAQMLQARESRTNPEALPDLVANIRRLGEYTPTGSVNDTASTGDFSLQLDPGALLVWHQACATRLAPLIDLLIQPTVDRAAASEILDALANTALDARLTGLASLLSRPVFLQGEKTQRLAAAADLFSRLRFLAAHTEFDSGLPDTALLTRQWLLGWLKQSAARLGDRFSTFSTDLKTSSPRQLLSEIEQASTELADLCEIQNFPVTANLIRLLRQFFREQRRTGNQILDEMIQAATIIASMPAELEADEDESDAYITMCRRLTDQLRHYSGQVDGRLALASEAEHITDCLEISPGLIESLMPEALEHLAKATEEQQSIVEIDADMESEPSAGDALINWISSAGTLIHSQTLLARSAPGDSSTDPVKLKLLCALPLTMEEIRHHFARFDPDRRYFKVSHCHYRDSAPNNSDRNIDNPDKSAVARKSGTVSTLRVDSDALDQFVDRVGELVMQRNILGHQLVDNEVMARENRIRSLLEQRSVHHLLSDTELDEVSGLLNDLIDNREAVLQTVQRLASALTRLQDDVMLLRVVPIAVVFNRFPRVVRDVSHSLGKRVRLDLQGGDTRIDKSLADVLIEPLMHMVRNALDHGIEHPEVRAAAGKPEEGSLIISARQVGNRLAIELKDDGAGLDPEKLGAKALKSGLITGTELQKMSDKDILTLIFQPGFSTSEKITEVSGRGVGMDVVRTGISQMGGQIELTSSPGAGTAFLLKLPLSVAIQTVVQVRSGVQKAAIPDRNISEVLSINAAQMKVIQGQACAVLRGATLPVYRLDRLLGHDIREGHTGDHYTVVVITDGQRRVGLFVDQIIGRSEIFIRDVHEDITAMPGVAGASVLGDGSVIIIVDCENLFELASNNAQSLASLTRAS